MDVEIKNGLDAIEKRVIEGFRAAAVGLDPASDSTETREELLRRAKPYHEKFKELGLRPDESAVRLANALK